ncbi:SDR family NAD(P)-dependent oxidoreductase [Streptomyces sp. NPDC059104]|uniref:type I polyketide synthase n=1 Tax=Streptomyces sp. NPDC059104 TaxID=3346729 RepID=UPI00368DF9B2
MKPLEPIAVIGMAGRFPGASDLDQYWKNLVDGRDCITDLDEETLLAAGVPAEELADPSYVRRRPLVSDVESFDAAAFAMTPRETEIRDPQQRLFLETAHSVLEHGGYDPRTFGGGIGVYAGTNVNRYRIDHVEEPDIVDSVGWIALEIANAPDYLSTFVSYKLGLKGPSMTIQTACSTSLVAVHMACSGLRMGECDMAIAGGANLEMPLNRGYQYMEGGISAPDGTPRPFDKDAGGTNFGNGVGAVLLKRLSDALADGDTVYAVIRGSAINNDGDRKVGFSAPSPSGQTACIIEALTNSETAPESISYVEAHGTGTVMGDPIEVAGLTEAYRTVAEQPLPPGSCGLGSVKSNVGHLGQAAGISGLIKTILALVNEQIPASINYREPNPKLDLANTPFYINDELRPWPRTDGTPRRAAVSSFGIGGTNAHLILEEAPSSQAAAAAPKKPELIVWSAADDTAASALTSRLAQHFASLPDDRFTDAVHTLRVGRSPRRVRAAVVAGSPAQAAELLTDGGQIVRGDKTKRDVTFLFPGQGAQFPQMARSLYESVPQFRQGCDRAFEELEPLLGRDLREVWLSDAGQDALSETSVAQPLLYVIGYTWAHCLMHWGVRPDRLVGHSIGEVAAAAVAGVFSFSDGLRAVAARSTLMQAMPRGGMLAVAAPREDLAPYLGGDVCAAAFNGPRQSVLAGPEEALAEIAERLREARIGCRALGTSHAFHSAMMGPAAEDFEKALSSLTLNPPRIPLISSATGAELTAEEATSPAFWARQLVEPVLFADAASTVLAGGPTFLVETGPGHTLSALLRVRPEVRSGESVIVPAMAQAEADEDDADLLQLSRTLGRLWVAGVPVDFGRLDAGSGANRVAVPGYPYQRKRHWIERTSVRKARQSQGGPAAEAPQTPSVPAGPEQSRPVAGTSVTEAVVNGPVSETTWTLGSLEWVRRSSGLSPVADAEADGATAVTVLPAGREDAVFMRTALQQAGYHTVRVRAGDGGGEGFDLGSEQAWDELFRRADERRPSTVVAYGALLDVADTVTLDTLDEQLEHGFHALLGCVKAISRAQRRNRRPVTLVVLVRHAVDVSGTESVNPAAAMVVGLTRTIEQEYPNIRCVLLDVAADTRVGALAAQLASLDEPLLALRGTTLWAPVLRPLERTARPGRLRLRQRGVYLVTGGLGGIGLTVANALAETGLRPRIALLGRSGMPDPGTDRGRTVAAAVAEMEEAGAEVLVVRGDAGDLESLRTAVAEVEAAFGTVNGVVHSAGLPGGGLLERRSRQDIDAVLGIKVRGTLVLEEVFASRAELDFLTLFSSQAGVVGLAGSGDYAAANAFLDAHAHAHSGDRWTVAVNWPGWAEVGMAAQSDVSLTLLTGADDPRPAVNRSVSEGEFRRVLTPGESWEVDEHQFDGHPVPPGTALLELVVTAALEQRIHAPGTPIELRESVFLAPVRPTGPTEFGVVFSPMAGMHRFRVQTRPAGSDEPWTLHANGVLAEASIPQPAPVEIDELTSRFEPIQNVGLTSWISFGPRWNTVGPVSGTFTERVAHLRLPEEFQADVETHPLHAALLDVATALLPLSQTDAKYIPFLYRRLTFFGALPAHIVVHAKLGDGEKGVRTMDLDLYDAASGELRVSVGSFTLREVQPEDFVRTLAEPVRPSARRPAPERKAVAPAAAVPASAPAGRTGPGLLSPLQGAEVFLELVNGSYPPAVIVDAPGPRMRARGLVWTDAAVPLIQAPRPVPVAPVAPVAPVVPVVPVAAAAVVPPVAPVAPVVPAAAPVVTPGGGHQEIMAGLTELWSEALGIEQIDEDEDFFDLGGNSLAAVQLIARMKERFGIELGAGSMFELNTIRLLADEIIRETA